MCKESVSGMFTVLLLLLCYMFQLWSEEVDKVSIGQDLSDCMFSDMSFFALVLRMQINHCVFISVINIRICVQ